MWRRVVLALSLASLLLNGCTSQQSLAPKGANEPGPPESARAAPSGPTPSNPSGAPEVALTTPPPDQSPAARMQGPSPADDLLLTMTLREQIAQRFITFLPREDPLDYFRKGLQRGPVGGIIIYPWNFTSVSELRTIIARLDGMTRRTSGGVGLFVSLDQEGGRVRAVRSEEILQLPSAHNLGRHQDPELIEAVAYANGRELRRLGVNMNLSPVLDLYPLSDRTIIGDRSFGGNPAMVAALGEAYLRGSFRAGIIAVPKHFPGHGVTTVDSHGRLPVSPLTWEQLSASHAIPFRSAVAAGADAIMTAHILFPRIDPDHPVTLSERFLSELLRGELGFDGIVITDAIEMGAIARHYRTKEMLLRAFSSGVDVVLVHRNLNVWDLIDMTEGMVRIGLLEEAAITAGTRRILRVKSRYGLLPGR